ncbi:MAG: PIG-L family deacetylase [Candidatus Levybacteria bacterium]|nr:PIG-L family deacetylase [Candidatus Levybacteria bacterium]
MKPVVAVFAHPDDEVFGPGGTMAIFAKEREVYVICVTDGDAGMNSLKDDDGTKSLGEIRKEEMRASAASIGVKEVIFLGYKDGTLCNNLYHEIAAKVQTQIESLEPGIIMTYEPRGVSGHIDHITVSMITSFVFERVPAVEELWYYCMSEYARSFQKPYFIYFPPGYKDSEISKVVNIEPVWDQKVTAMTKHESQKHDIDNILGAFRHKRKEEYFIILKREDLPKTNTE